MESSNEKDRVPSVPTHSAIAVFMLVTIGSTLGPHESTLFPEQIQMPTGQA